MKQKTYFEILKDFLRDFVFGNNLETLSPTTFNLLPKYIWNLLTFLEQQQLDTKQHTVKFIRAFA